VSFATGATSTGSSPSSVRKVKPSGTFHIKAYGDKPNCHVEELWAITLPSSEPEAISESLKGLLHSA
jgi:hypothetical protein